MSLAHECQRPLEITLRLYLAMQTRVPVFLLSTRLSQALAAIVETSLGLIGAQIRLHARDPLNTRSQVPAGLNLMEQR